MMNHTRHITLDERSEHTLTELNELAEERYPDSDVKVSAGQYPFRSAIIRRALQIAAPAIRSGLEQEGVAFLL